MTYPDAAMGSSSAADVSAARPERSNATADGGDGDAASGADIVVATTGLRKVYPSGLVAVEALDLSVRRGEIFGLLGPNGAGKSTTVGMLTTRVIPTAGQAVVNGIDVVAHPARAKQAIGVVSQANTLDQGLNVWENLYFHGRYFGLGVAPGTRAIWAARLPRWSSLRTVTEAPEPFEALSPRGVSMARIRPWSTMARRSQCSSASSM